MGFLTKSLCLFTVVSFITNCMTQAYSKPGDFKDGFANGQSDQSSVWRNEKTLLTLPAFHDFNASEPIKVVNDGVIIQNQVKSNWGNWQSWKQCPEGMFAVGYQVFSLSPHGKIAGTFHLNFLCRSPGGYERKTIIEDTAPGHLRPPTVGQNSWVCTGTIVGFRLHVKPDRNRKFGTDNIYGICSTDIKHREEVLVGRKFDPDWTLPTNCGKHQAMCGFQVQMGQPYANQEKAMNNLRIKCCQVPDPLEDCVPMEVESLVKTCDNSKGVRDIPCEYEISIGLSVDYAYEKALIFYFSIGYDFMTIKDYMKTKIVSELVTKTDLEYSWDDVASNVLKPESIYSATFYVEQSSSVELYQIVGKCDFFLVRTNRFVKVIRDNDGWETVEYFDVN